MFPFSTPVPDQEQIRLMERADRLAREARFAAHAVLVQALPPLIRRYLGIESNEVDVIRCLTLEGRLVQVAVSLRDEAKYFLSDQDDRFSDDVRDFFASLGKYAALAEHIVLDLRPGAMFRYTDQPDSLFGLIRWSAGVAFLAQWQPDGSWVYVHTSPTLRSQYDRGAIEIVGYDEAVKSIPC